MSSVIEARKWLAQQRSTHQIIRGVMLRFLEEGTAPGIIHLSSDLFKDVKKSARDVLGDKFDSKAEAFIVSLGIHEVKLMHSADFAEKTLWAERG